MSAGTTEHALRVVDETARRSFESAWLAGAPAPIEQFLPQPQHPSYQGTLEELVFIELELWWKAYRQPAGKPGPLGPPPRVEDYLTRFPDLNQPQLVLSLLKHEYKTRLRCGDRPNLAEYQARFPGLTFPIEEWAVTPNRSVRRGEPLLQIPGYEVLEVIGRGGMGVVLKAVQQGLNRVVAVKQVISGALASDEELGRFQTEAQAVAHVHHPNIVQIYEVGEAEGRPFLALEFVAGGTLAQRLGGNPVAGRAAAEMVATLARALQTVHERGILHRDLKPANVLLTPDGQPKITDFGLAKRVEGTTPTLTETGAIIGTPSYMAPEQAAGKAKELGPAVDIYALGAILYEMLTGRPPFKGETPMDTVFQVLQQQPVAPRQLQPKVARDLETICLKCLEKERRRRYASAAALADDLDRFLAGEPIAARPVTRLERGLRWCRREPMLASLSAAAVLALVSAVVGLFFWQRADFERRRQASEFHDQKQQDALRRRERLRAAALHNGELASAELKANRFASAEKFLALAVDNLRGEEEVEDLAAPVTAQHDRVSRLVDFYRFADKAERLAFLENDRSAAVICENGLRRLGVLKLKDWWTQLPANDLNHEQAAKLQRDANHQLMLLAGLWVKDAADSPGTKQAGNPYRDALEVIEQVQQFHSARNLPPSLAAQVLQTHCHVSLLQLGKIKSLGGLEPVTASDCYFLGIAHLWMAQSPKDWISRALTGTLRLLGLDLGEPGPAARRLLLRAAADETSHYWSHFWLGWALLAADDAAGAELAFTTCVTLRPEDGPAYAERARALAFQHVRSKDALARKELERRCRADGQRATHNAPHDWYTHFTQLHAYAVLDWRQETLDATARMLEVIPPPDVLRGRSRAEQAILLNGVAEYLDKFVAIEPSNRQAMSLLAFVQLFLGQDADAARTAAHVLKSVPDDSRALRVRGALALRAKQLDSAAGDFQAVLAKEPRSYLAARGHAQVHELAQRWEAAAASYAALLQMAVTDWQRLEAHLGAARALTQLGKHAEAEQALAEAREIDREASAALQLPTTPPKSAK